MARQGRGRGPPGPGSLCSLDRSLEATNRLRGRAQSLGGPATVSACRACRQPEAEKGDEDADGVRHLVREELLECGAEQQAEGHEEDVPLQRRLRGQRLLPHRIVWVEAVRGALELEVAGARGRTDGVAVVQDDLVDVAVLRAVARVDEQLQLVVEVVVGPVSAPRGGVVHVDLADRAG